MGPGYFCWGGFRYPRSRCYNRYNWCEGKALESALEILMNRYAKGEITKEEYEQMKQDITEK